LHAAEGETQGLTQSADQQGLAQPRHPFQEDMSAGKDGRQGAINDGFMADDDLADLGLELLVVLAECFNGLFDAHGLKSDGQAAYSSSLK